MAITATEEGSADELAAIDQQVLRLFAMVTGGLAAATAAFLGADCAAANALVAEDPLIDGLQSSTEARVRGVLIHPSAFAEAERRMLVAVLQIVPELERSGDLVEHIAMRTQQGLAGEISARARGFVEEMGELGVLMWKVAADAYGDRDPGAAEQLRSLDDRLDDLHVRLTAELAETATSIPVAMEMGLVGRFYERLGDHAVNVARRVQHLVAFTDGGSQW